MTSSESLSLADHDDILGFVIGLTIPEFQASERDRVQDQNFEKRVHYEFPYIMSVYVPCWLRHDQLIDYTHARERGRSDKMEVTIAKCIHEDLVGKPVKRYSYPVRGFCHDCCSF